MSLSTYIFQANILFAEPAIQECVDLTVYVPMYAYMRTDMYFFYNHKHNVSEAASIGRCWARPEYSLAHSCEHFRAHLNKVLAPGDKQKKD